MKKECVTLRRYCIACGALCIGLLIGFRVASTLVDHRPIEIQFLDAGTNPKRPLADKSTGHENRNMQVASPAGPLAGATPAASFPLSSGVKAEDLERARPRTDQRHANTCNHRNQEQFVERQEAVINARTDDHTDSRRSARPAQFISTMPWCARWSDTANSLTRGGQPKYMNAGAAAGLSQSGEIDEVHRTPPVPFVITLEGLRT